MSCSLFSSEDVFKQVEDLFKNYGNARYLIDEKITQKDHALQCAYLAKISGASDEVILAALLHDIGQMTEASLAGNSSVLHVSHDVIGQLWLKEKGFSEFVCDVARFHTLAKIILCEQDPSYFLTLSKASQDSYLLQKNKFSDPGYSKTVDEFLNHPRLPEFLFLRRCDDLAKMEDFTSSQGLPDLQEYENLFYLKSFHQISSVENWQQTLEQLFLPQKK